MRILIVTQYFWPESFRINDLATGLRERGHEVTVYTGKPNYPEGRYFPGYGFFRRTREDYEGVRVIRAPLIPRGRSGRVGLVLNYLSFALCAALLAPFLCRGRYDAILVYEPSPITVGLPAVVIKWVKRAPLLFWVQDLWPENLSATGMVRSKWVLGLVARFARFLYRRSDIVLVQSEAFIQPIRALGIEQRKILYYPNSAEAIYRPVAAATPPSDGFRVMFAGNIGAAQDFDTILAAAELMREERGIHWIIVGDGRMHGRVESEVTRRGLGATVQLLGRHPVESMPAFFATADALLVTLAPEPVFSLTIPSKVQSYLACGRPIVGALDGEGARVIVESGAGIAGPAGDAAGLAESVRRLHGMTREARESMGACGRRYFEQHFERERLLGRLEGWMSELAGR
jgi:colanic acid biosynthesis glycosyl transferase WcaI